MNFGGPIDLTPFGALLEGISWLYWLIGLSIILLALWWPQRWWMKLLAAAVVAGAVVYPVFVRPVEQRVQALKAEQQAAQARFDAAKAVFDERCKGAGEKIVRTVDKVDGVVWMKWRDKREVKDDFDQFKLFDPYGRDCTAEDCIESLLRLNGADPRFAREVKLRQERYQFVESVDPGDGRAYRYTLFMALPLQWTTEAVAEFKKNRGTEPPDFSYRPTLKKQPIDKLTARYGITWDDVSTRADREHWVAGGSLKIIDLQANEVIAERVGYMMDPGLGSRAGFRTPWAMAERMACPPFAVSEAGNPMKYSRSRQFVLNALKPQKEN